ncbi:MAG: hypothetical protein KTR31_16270 [Myxococcales bacterium]|nr:hypothetical protein [Myxococcales bacterium]
MRALWICALVACGGDGATDPTAMPQPPSTQAPVPGTPTVSPPSTSTGPCDPVDATWSTPELVDEGGLTQPYGGAVAVDDTGRAVLLAQERIGPRTILWLTRFDGGWAKPALLHDRQFSDAQWSPRVRLAGTGLGAGAFRMDLQTTGGLFRFLVAEDGTESFGSGLGSDQYAQSVEIDLDGEGHVVGAYTAVEKGEPAVWAYRGNEDPWSVHAPPGGAYLNAWSLAEDGTGMAFARDDDGALALPYTPDEGFGAPERLAPEPTNGLGGVWFGGGRAVFVYGTIAGPAERVQLFARERLPDGTWEAPVRFDTGDGTTHAFTEVPRSAGPNAAFLQWREPSGIKIGRHVVGQGLVDVVDLARAPDAVAWDSCGRGLVMQRRAEPSELTALPYAPGVGWLPEQVVDVSLATSGWVGASLATSGQGMVVYEKQSRYWSSSLTP